MSAPTGYVQGMSTAQAADTDRPLSRADEEFQPPAKLRDMIETKRILLKNVARASDDEYYLANKAKYEAERDRVLMQLEGLEKRRADGPAICARLEKEIADLEHKVHLSENKAKVNKVRDMLAMAKAMGIDISKLGG